MNTLILNPAETMDRYALAREFEFIKACDEIQRCTDMGELKQTAIHLLRLNRGIREMVAVMAQDEIPPA